MKPELEFVFEAGGRVAPPEVIGETPTGFRRFIPILEGPFEGPNIRGVVMPGATDWQTLRADGVTEFDAIYALKTDDGVIVQVRNRGLRHGPDEVMARLAAGEDVEPGSYYFRTAPVFSAPKGRYDWLNRSLFICTGARYAESVRLWFYRVL